MTVVNQTRQGFGFEWIAAVKLQPFLSDGLQQRRTQIGLDKQMIRCDAGLPRIESLPPDQSACRDGKIGPRQHDRRVFASEFQGYGREVGGGSLQHLGSDLPATGEEDVIEALPNQLSGNSSITIDDLNHMVWEVLCYQPLDELGCCWRMFGRFDHGGVAGCKSAH